MKRRTFLKAGLYGSTLLSAATTLGWPLRGLAAYTGAPVARTLVNVMLNGGIDWRFAIVPTPDYEANYIDKFWAARKVIYNAVGYADYPAMYENEYRTVEDPGSGFAFGIHNSCGWLAQQFELGRVAIVANTCGSRNRNHDHSVLIMNTGDPLVGPIDKDREGWGGRLVNATGYGTNVVTVAPSVTLLAYGVNPDNRLAQVVHGKDMRTMALPTLDATLPDTHARNVARRALRAYYTQRSAEIDLEKPADWPYRKFFQHHESVSKFGGQIQERLEPYPLPADLDAMTLDNDGFALQCKNLYDCCQTSDILNFRLIEMYYSGFDTHADEQSTLTTTLQDILGTGGGLDTVTSRIAADMPNAIGNLTFLFSSDFGRQLMGNGTNGTDHGTGTYSILIGHHVRGGTYGDMFPLRESLPDPGDSLGRSPFELHGKDITGLTSFERVYARACDWVMPGTGDQVFPGAATSMIERDASNVSIDLPGLFTG